jgi:hypothetical protein
MKNQQHSPEDIYAYSIGRRGRKLDSYPPPELLPQERKFLFMAVANSSFLQFSPESPRSCANFFSGLGRKLQFKVVFIFGVLLSAPLHSVMTRAVIGTADGECRYSRNAPRRA